MHQGPYRKGSGAVRGVPVTCPDKGNEMRRAQREGTCPGPRKEWTQDVVVVRLLVSFPAYLTAWPWR